MILLGSFEVKTLKEDILMFQTRKNIYEFLHLIFSEPLLEKDFLEIREKGNLIALKDFGNGGLFLYDFFTSKDLSRLKDEKQEFYRLFIGPNVLLAPPWESVYRGRDRIINDFPALEISQLYDDFGIELSRKNNEIEDHLVLELEFMVYLIKNSFTGSKFNYYFLEGQRRLLFEHFSKWIPAVASDIVRNSNSKLYKGAAILLHEFIKFDYEYIQELSSAEI